MRIVHPTDDQLRAFLAGHQIRSAGTLNHLLLCDKCQVRLAETAERSSLVGEMAAAPLDRSLADSVMGRIAERSRRRTAVHAVLYSLGSLATVVTVVIVAGADLYSGVVQPVWGVLVAGMSGLTDLLQVSAGYLKSLSAGQTVLGLAAVAAVFWVGLLDRLVTRVTLHKSRA